jgi:hypothetical protein
MCDHSQWEVMRLLVTPRGLNPTTSGYTAFDFTLPTGEQISDYLPLVQQPDGTYE